MCFFLGSFFDKHRCQHGFAEPIHESLAFYQECVIDIVSTAEHGLTVGHAFGEDYVCRIQGSFCLLAQQVDLGAGNPVAVVDDREGNPHSLRICTGGVVDEDVTTDAEGDFQMGIFLCDLFRENPVEADFTGVVRQVQQLSAGFQLCAEVNINFLLQFQIKALSSISSSFSKLT